MSVPVLRAHAESINLTLKQPLSPQLARALLGEAAGVDDREKNLFPMPKIATWRDAVYVGGFGVTHRNPREWDSTASSAAISFGKARRSMPCAPARGRLHPSRSAASPHDKRRRDFRPRAARSKIPWRQAGAINVQADGRP